MVLSASSHKSFLCQHLQSDTQHAPKCLHLLLARAKSGLSLQKFVSGMEPQNQRTSRRQHRNNTPIVNSDSDVHCRAVESNI